MSDNPNGQPPDVQPTDQPAEEIPEWLQRIRAKRAAEAGHTAVAPDPAPAQLEAPPPPPAAFEPPPVEEFETPPEADAAPGPASESAPAPPAEPAPNPSKTPVTANAPDPTHAPDPANVSDSADTPDPVAPPADDTPEWLRELEAAQAEAIPADDAPPWVRAAAEPARSEAPSIPAEAPIEPAAPHDPDALTTEQAEVARQIRARRRQERRAQARRNSPIASMSQSMVVVAAAAVLIATIFTFWTPASFLSDETREGLRPAYATLNAQSPPTPIPTPIWMRRIGIVSGHWGPYPTTGRSDPGAVCPDGLTEAEVNRSVAQLVVQQLSGRGYDVDLLDEWDPRLSEYQAAVLLSIHADSCHQFDLPGATGFKVAPPASRTSTRADDLRLRDCLVEKYALISGLPLHPSLTRDMTEYHSFGEISPVTPAAIIELGFLYEDRDILENRPDLLAEGIVSGLLCFLENTPPTPLPELTPWPTAIATPTPLETPGVS
jgi:N-acetylmuramoyl-L-alanine amidase